MKTKGQLRNLHLILWIGLLAYACGGSTTDGVGGASGTSPVPASPAGALIDVTMAGRVGVLLDEIPATIRDRVAEDLIAKPQDFWIERATMQMRYTNVQLVYRKYYFKGKLALPLTPEPLWQITIGGMPQRATIGEHDYVAVDYRYQTTILTDAASPATSEPALATEGGTWDEPFIFPLDPTLFMQRTGYAAITEDQFPPNSVDAEAAYLFYDTTCKVESPDEPLCHHTQPGPTESALDALDNHVGRFETKIRFERLLWDAKRADEVRYNPQTNTEYPDMTIFQPGLEINRVVYRYFTPDDCSVVEGSIEAPGWRRLLLFESHGYNVGGKGLVIGDVDYFLAGAETANADRGVYELSPCHQHYHFKYYGDFSFGSLPDIKPGFCLESTDRQSNFEGSPLNTHLDECSFQGVEVGWGDNYMSSLASNWVDITALDTSQGPATADLTFHTNPDGFMCEGKQVLDANGNLVWEDTKFLTGEGKVVQRPKCDFFEGWDNNNVGTIQVTIPEQGGMLTKACQGMNANDIGPYRNCGFTQVQGIVCNCTPGQKVELHYTVADASKPQVVRICEVSQVLGVGVDCHFNEALANVVIDGTNVSVSFTSPLARDANEPGGEYAVYVAAVYPPDGVQFPVEVK